MISSKSRGWPAAVGTAAAIVGSLGVESPGVGSADTGSGAAGALGFSAAAADGAPGGAAELPPLDDGGAVAGAAGGAFSVNCLTKSPGDGKSATWARRINTISQAAIG